VRRRRIKGLQRIWEAARRQVGRRRRRVEGTASE